MSVLYPATLPAPSAKGLKITQQESRKKIQFDAKNSRSINRASNTPKIVDCIFLLDSVQVGAFDYFFKFTANYGNSWIDASWLEELGFNNHLCRFLTVPKTAKNGSSWQIQAIVEIQVQGLQVESVTPSWGVSNIQAAQFPPTDNLVHWYAADQDPNPDNYNYSVFENIPKIAGVGQWIAIKSTSTSRIVFINGFRGVRVAGNLATFQNREAQYSGRDINRTLAVVMTGSHGSGSIGSLSNNGRPGINVQLNNQDFKIYSSSNATPVDTYNAPTTNAQGRNVLVVRLPASGSGGFVDANVNNNPKVTSSQALAQLSGDILNIGTWNYSVWTGIGLNHVHEFLHWDRILTDHEVAVVTSEMITKWQI